MGHGPPRNRIRVGRVVTFIVLVWSAATSVAALAQSRPAFAASANRVVTIALPTSVLKDREVHTRLQSGLTATFLVEAKQRDANRRGAARIEIRYDLWDEVWLARRIELDGKEERQRIATREALDKWWSSPIRIFTAAADRVALNVTLSVLPFSRAEGEDAREWMSVREGGSPLINAMIGTTVSAKPIRTYRWSADVVAR